MTTGKIYVIKSPQTDQVYYGSTMHPLNIRFSVHKSQYKKFLEGKIPYVCSSSRILHYKDAFIELIEDYECETKEDLEKREMEYIKNNPCVNIQGKGATWTKEDHRAYQKEYRLKNAEKEKEYKKAYHKSHYKPKKVKNNNPILSSENHQVAPPLMVSSSIDLNTSLLLTAFLLTTVLHTLQNTSAELLPRK